MMKFSRDTKVIFSVSSKPGNFGTFFHNYLYNKMELDYFYKSCPCSSLVDALSGMRSLGLHGMSVSMPFKQDAVIHMDELDSFAQKAQAVNTVVNLYDGKLKGYNTDLFALETILKSTMSEIQNVLIIGNGAIAQMSVNFLKEKNISVLTRGKEQFNEFKIQNPDISIFDDSISYQLIINATPQKLNQFDVLEKTLKTAGTILDFPIHSKKYRPEMLSDTQNYYSGFDITILQGQRQFAIYTGIEANKQDIIDALDSILI